MNSLKSIIIMMLFMSCNIAGHKTAYSLNIERVGKSMVDESEVVHSRFPFSTASFADSLLACIVDYKQIVFYNINSGNVFKSGDVDSIMLQDGFSNAEYIKENCLNIYKNRRYVTETKAVEETKVPLLKVLKILSPITSLDSINVLVDALTPYETDFVYEGKNDTALWLSYSTMIINLNLNQKSINKITPIHSSLIEKNNDLDSALRIYVGTEFGSFLYNNKFYAHIGPDLNKYQKVAEVGIFNLGGKQSVQLDSYMHPDIYRELGRKRIIWQHFLADENEQVFCNSFYDIYSIDEPGQKKKIISFKKFLDTNKTEYITNFSKLKDGNFIIQTVISDSGKHYYDFRFYSPSADELSPSKLRVITKTISPNVIFKDNKIIFFSKDEEHYYIETYKIVEH